MVKLFCLSILLCFNMRSDSQTNSDKDASVLISALKKNPTGSTRVDVLLDLSRYFYFEQGNTRESLDSMFRFLREADQICDADTSLRWEQPEIYCYLGKYYHKTGNMQLATNYDNKVTTAIKSITSLEDQALTWDALAFGIKVMDTIGVTRIDC